MPTARRPASFSNASRWHDAESLGLDTQGRVELAAEVFQRNGGRQLDDLRLGEMLLQLGEQRVDYLQRSIDALALEVERIGEAQRFKDKHLERGETSPLKKPDQ